MQADAPRHDHEAPRRTWRQSNTAALPWTSAPTFFSSGVVLYQLLTGVKPFTGTTEAIAYKSCYEPHVDRPRSHPSSRRCRSTRCVAQGAGKETRGALPRAQELRGAIMDAYSCAGELRSYRKRPLSTKRAHRPPRAAQRVRRRPTRPRASRTVVPPLGGTPRYSKLIEQQLMRFLGPVAQGHRQASAKNTQELDTLVALLAESLGSKKKRSSWPGGNSSPARLRAIGTAGKRPRRKRGRFRIRRRHKITTLRAGWRRTSAR